MVTHHPQSAHGHGHPEVCLDWVIAGEDVGLVDLGPVDEEHTVSPLDDVTTDADDPLDEVAATARGCEPDEDESLMSATLLPGRREGVREPPLGFAKHHDVAPVQATHVAELLVDEHPVTEAARAPMQGWFHRSGRDEERLDEEGLGDQRCDDDGEEDGNHLLEEQPQAAGPGVPWLRTRWVQGSVPRLMPPLTRRCIHMSSSGGQRPTRRGLRHLRHSLRSKERGCRSEAPDGAQTIRLVCRVRAPRFQGRTRVPDRYWTTSYGCRNMVRAGCNTPAQSPRPRSTR